MALKGFWQQQIQGVEVEQLQVQFGLNFEAVGNLHRPGQGLRERRGHRHPQEPAK